MSDSAEECLTWTWTSVCPRSGSELPSETLRKPKIPLDLVRNLVQEGRTTRFQYVGRSREQTQMRPRCSSRVLPVTFSDQT